MKVENCKKNRSPVFFASALAMAIAGVSGTTSAQQQETRLEEISVTGSRLRTSGMETPNPMTVMDASELASMAPGNLIESLTMLPIFLNNNQPQTQFNFAGSAGASNVNMRGIGAQRTLVLLDGRRMVPSSRTNTIDINLFPDAMIRSVETVTGGASAAYGTDAVAGVVNFILDTDFEGVEAHFQGGSTSRGDGENWEGSFNYGTDLGDKTHLLFSIGGFRQNGIDAYQGRDWYQGWGTVTNPAWQSAVNAGQCQVNVACAAGPQLIRAPQVVSTQYTFGGMTVSPVPALNNLQFLSDGTVTPFQFSNLSVAGAGTLSQSIHPVHGGGSGDNFEADRGGEGGLIPDISRNTAFLYIDHDLTDNITIYAQGVHGESRTNAPGFSSLMFGPWQPTLYADNAFLPGNLRQAMLDNGVNSVGFSSLRSSADIGVARFEQRNRMSSGTVGFKADITDGFMAGWHLDGYYQFGETDTNISMIDFARVDRIFLAMDSVVNPANGSIMCRAAMFNPEQYGNCVPLNLLGAGRASQEAIEYATGRSDGSNIKQQNARLKQHVADIALTGDLHQGWGAGAIAAAFGGHFRQDSIVQRITDVTNPTNDPTNVAVPVNNPAMGIQGIPGGFAGTATGYQFSGAQNFDGRINVYELFSEVLVPVISDVPLIQQLNVNGAARWANYTGSGVVWSYKGGIDWRVTDEVRLRSTLSRDVRAGSLSERYDQQGQGASAEDPFRDGSAYAFAQTIGGNPNIDPEKALTYTGGIVYQPLWLDGFSISADYYRIRTEGLIAQLGVQNIVNQCFQGSASQCANITRGDPAQDPLGVGLITNVFNGFQNLGEAIVAGVDVEVMYRRDINLFGGLGAGGENIIVRGLWGYLDQNSIDSDPRNPASNTLIQNAGNMAMAMPRNTVTANMTYMNGPLRAFVQQRYIGSGKHSAQFNGINAIEGVHINSNKVDKVFYTDMNLSWTIDQANGGSMEIFGNVTNLFDRDPPIRGAFFNFFGSTQQIDALHDLLGRRYVAGVRVRF